MLSPIYLVFKLQLISCNSVALVHVQVDIHDLHMFRIQVRSTHGISNMHT